MSNLTKKIIISIDFEMRWGVKHKYGLNFEGYKKNLDGCTHVVSEMLDAFKGRNLRATWATVGAIALNGWDDYFRYKRNDYKFKNISYAFNEKYCEMDKDGILHFSPTSIRKILNTEGQDLGSHSFTHANFQDPGLSAQNLVDDLKLVEKVFMDKYSFLPVSFVYPFNMIAHEHYLNRTSIKIWRDSNPLINKRVDQMISSGDSFRALRILDSICSIHELQKISRGVMTVGTFFVRFNLPETLWRLHLKKLKKGMEGLKYGEEVHIWWHPHNVSFDMSIGINRLNQLLDIVAEVSYMNNIRSCNMADLIS